MPKSVRQPVARNELKAENVRAKTIHIGPTIISIRSKDHKVQALITYLSELRAECNALPISAMGGEQDARKDVTLDQVYIALDTDTPVQDDESQMQKSSSGRFLRKPGRVGVFDAVVANERVVLLGGPGGGKSSFVNQLIAEICARWLKKPRIIKNAPEELLTRLPAKIILRELAQELAQKRLNEDSEDKTLVKAIWDHLESRVGHEALSLFRYRLKDESKGLIAFDGLDETPEDSRKTIRRAVGAFLNRLPGCRAIVTCRVRSYLPEFRFADFPDFTLGRLSEEKVSQFVAGWYNAHVALGHLKSKEAEERIRDLTRAATGPYASLAEQSPLLLTVMAIVHRKGTQLPSQEVKLYDEMVKVLLSRWQLHKKLHLHQAVQNLLNDPNKLDEVMQELAFALHDLQGRQNDPQAYMPRGDALNLLESQKMLGPKFPFSEFLDYVDQVAGLFVGFGGSADPADKRPNAYGFLVRQFQEFLAGRRIVWGNLKARRNKLLELAQKPEWWAEPARFGWESLYYLGNTRNVDVQELAESLVDSPDTPARKHAMIWAGKMAALAGAQEMAAYIAENNGANWLSAQLIPGLQTSLQDEGLPALERAEAGKTLAALGDPRFDPHRLYLPNDDWLGFERIPADEHFMIGTRRADFEKTMTALKIPQANWDHWRDEINDEPVKTREFYMARYPVTVAQWKAFVENKRVAQPEFKITDEDSLRGVDNHPVVYVSWHDAMAYCDWLSEQIKTNAVFDYLELANKVRGGQWRIALPSELEWEKAALAGIAGAIFPWGDTPDPNKANYDETRIGGTSSVGCFLPNEYHVYDMTGNVWEWTRSLYGKWDDKNSTQKNLFSYPYAANDGREDEKADKNWSRVLRGGSWFDFLWFARCAARNGNQSDFRDYYFGFRVVCVPIF